MTISETLLPEFDNEMTNTRKILDCVPEEKFTWKPQKKSRTLGRRASHIAEMPYWATATITQDKLELTPEMKPFNAATKAELMSQFESNIATAREATTRPPAQPSGN